MSELGQFILKYKSGLVSNESFVLALRNWKYVSNEDWREQAPFVDGSFDEVEEAHYKGHITPEVYAEILYGYLEAQ